MGRNKHLDACGQLLFVVVLAINKRGVDGEAKRDQALAPFAFELPDRKIQSELLY